MYYRVLEIFFFFNSVVIWYWVLFDETQILSSEICTIQLSTVFPDLTHTQGKQLNTNATAVACVHTIRD